jgi:hypothetical protein
MSTKAIREALRELSELKGMTQVQAYAEVEAIEKACVALYLGGVVQCFGGVEHEDVEHVNRAAGYLMVIGQAVKEGK